MNSILHKNKRDYFFVCFYGHKERLVMSENLFLSFILLLLLSWWQFSKNFRGIKCWIIVHLNSVLRHQHKNSRHKLLELFVLNNAGIILFVFQHSNIAVQSNAVSNLILCFIDLLIINQYLLELVCLHLALRVFPFFCLFVWLSLFIDFYYIFMNRFLISMNFIVNWHVSS